MIDVIIEGGGNVIDVGLMASVDAVPVDMGSIKEVSPVLQDKTVVPLEQAVTVIADNGFDGLRQVDVDAIPSDYVGSAVPRNPDLSVSGKTVTAPSGYYSAPKSASVADGSARTPDTRIDMNLKMDIVGKRVTVIAQGSESERIVPVVTPGWVQNGTGGTVDVSAYGEMDLPLAKVQDKIVLNEKPQTIVSAPGWVSEDVEIPGIDSRYVGSDVPRRSSSDLSVSGRTVNAPAGYYANAASASVAQGSARTPETAITANPAISVDSNGLVSAIVSKTQSVTPIVSVGYVSSGTAGTVSVSGSATSQLPTQEAQTITPDRQGAVISAGKFLAGAQTVLPIPSNWNDMSAEWAFLGNNATYMGEIYAEDYVLADTDFNGWTPSTTAKVIIASKNLAARAIDLENYEYWVLWEHDIDVALQSGATQKVQIDRQYGVLAQNIHRRPYGFSNFETNTDSYNYNNNTLTASYAAYAIYWNASGAKTWSSGISYGFYPTMTAATFSSTSSLTPNLTIKTPTISARCSTTYMATARAAEIDQDNTTIRIRGHLFRVDMDTSFVRKIYKKAVDLYSNPIPALDS